MKLIKNGNIYIVQFNKIELEQFNIYTNLISLKSEYWEARNDETSVWGVYCTSPMVEQAGRKQLIEALLEFEKLQQELNL